MHTNACWNWNKYVNKNNTFYTSLFSDPTPLGFASIELVMISQKQRSATRKIFVCFQIYVSSNALMKFTQWTDPTTNFTNSYFVNSSSVIHFIRVASVRLKKRLSKTEYAFIVLINQQKHLCFSSSGNFDLFWVIKWKILHWIRFSFSTSSDFFSNVIALLIFYIFF